MNDGAPLIAIQILILMVSVYVVGDRIVKVLERIAAALEKRP